MLLTSSGDVAFQAYCLQGVSTYTETVSVSADGLSPLMTWHYVDKVRIRRAFYSRCKLVGRKLSGM